jgi:Holliday junction resolvasome RuvABC endonuclease subunit
MKIAGLDISLTSPAVVIVELDESLEIVGYDYINFCDTQKYQVHGHVYPIPEYTNEFERILGKNDFLVKELKKRGVSHYAIEGYSYGSKGNNSYNIAENTGYLKMELYKAGLKKREVEPTTNKLFFVGKGSATKEMMIRHYRSMGNPIGLPEVIVSSDASTCPLNDIVDAYSLAMFLVTEMRLRSDIISMNSLTEHTQNAFGCGKKRNKNKTPILETSFI